VLVDTECDAGTRTGTDGQVDIGCDNVKKSKTKRSLCKGGMRY